MPGLSTETATTIALVIGLAVSGCDVYNGNHPGTTLGGTGDTSGTASTGMTTGSGG